MRSPRTCLRWSERATELEPGLPFMWAQLGIRQLLFGDVDGARVSLEQAIELQPYHPLALVVLRGIAERARRRRPARLVEWSARRARDRRCEYGRRHDTRTMTLRSIGSSMFDCIPSTVASSP